jgi:GPH family glycoside/pentoside/hexuronide:cation symporter
MTDIAYALLTLGSSSLWGFVSGWILYFYIPPSGTPLVPIALYSVVMFLSRGINVAISLPIGFLSDQTRTPWGRRLPYIFAASFFMIGAFALLWIPPHSTESLGNLAYLAAVMVVFNIAYGFREIPYEALLPELAPEEQRRVNISGWKAGFQLVGAIFAGFIGPLIERWGYQNAALIFAGVMIPFFFVPLFFIRENRAAPKEAPTRLGFWNHLKLTLANRTFLIFISSWALSWAATTFILETIPYIATEICRGTEADTVYFYIPPIIVSLICFPIITQLANHYGKRIVFLGSLLLGALVLPCLLFISDSIPVPLLMQGVIWICLEAIALSGAQVLPTAILAEITDADAQVTGQRREGSYYGALGVMDQVSSGLASALLPLFLLLGRSNSDPQGPLGVRLLGLASGLAMFAAFLVFRKYNISIAAMPLKKDGK